MHLRFIGTADVERILAETMPQTLEAVRDAYVAHEQGRTIVPHSSFLRPPASDGRRFIALPAYLGGGEGEGGRSGLKWIGSYPGNVERGIERASSLIILNDDETGRPEVILEGSRISAARTGASAAVAASALRPEFHGPVGLIGAGPINASVLRYLVAAGVVRERAVVFDLDPERAARFAMRAAAEHPRLQVDVADRAEAVLETLNLVSFATTALEPHVTSLAGCQPGSLLLHISLRDLSPDAILEADNVVDDVSHVTRERTSVHLAAEQVGDQGFIRAELGSVLAGSAPRGAPDRVTVFSPFGLGALDLAVAALLERADPQAGIRIEDFAASSTC